jgi:hypothetical protein
MLQEPSITNTIFGDTRAAVIRPFAHEPSREPEPAGPLPAPPFAPLPEMALGLSKSLLGRLSTGFLSSEHALDHAHNMSHSTGL